MAMAIIKYQPLTPVAFQATDISANLHNKVTKSRIDTMILRGWNGLRHLSLRCKSLEGTP